jgi:hypothetical protein
MRTTRLQVKPEVTSVLKHQPPPVHTVPVSPWSNAPSGAGPIIQRKCACGGGCPSCEAEKDNVKLQTKLAISSPGDAFEQEADTVADQVMRMPDPASQRQRTNAFTSNNQAPLIKRQTNGAAGSSTVASNFISRLGAGVPLDSASRSYFEPRFGRDFSAVRVHTDETAAGSAAKIAARAYTVGNNVVFGAGEWSPSSTAGRRLLAHELAHVAQQTGGTGTIQRQPVEEEPGNKQVATGDSAVPMDEPNKAPECDDICGNSAAKCIVDSHEKCSDDITKKVETAWKTSATQLATAIDALAESPLSATTAASLKANFNWSSGNSPADLPTTVANNLSAAATKMSDNLCIRCVAECQKGGKAQITRAKNKNCLGSNCFTICPTFVATDSHVLTHELFHRVVSSVEDLYRGQSGYPPPPSMALKMADCYASLIDDTAAASAAAAKAKGGKTP